MSERLRADLHSSWNNNPELKSFRDKLKYSDASTWQPQGKTSVEETSSSKNFTYKGEKSIQSEQEAIAFFNVDLDKYEVERFVVNSWDVTMKIDDEPVKRTNYQVKLFLRKIQKLILQKPKIKPFKFKPKEKGEMWLVLSCCHFPFHNKKIWNSILHLIKDNKKNLTGIILNGDFLDLRVLSKHEEFIPDGLTLAMEYESGLKGILEIEQAIGKENIKKVFHYGNHCERFYRDKKAVLMYGSALPAPHEALRLEELGYKVQTDYKDGYTTLGNDLEVLHGIYFGETAAKKHLEMMPDRSVIFGHTHRFSSHDNGRHTAWNTGCLIDIMGPGFKYANRQQKSRWRNGFAIAYINRDGEHSVVPVKCLKENFFFGGKVY